MCPVTASYILICFESGVSCGIQNIRNDGMHAEVANWEAPFIK